MNTTVTINSTVELYVETCCACGVWYGFDKNYERHRREDGKEWYCPNGHNLHFGGSTVERLEKKVEQARRERDAAQQATAEWREWYNGEAKRRKDEQRRHAATKGQLTRERTRAGNGVCLYCHRHFVNVERHYKTKHPEHKQEG